MEVADFLERYADLKTKAGHQRVVRHGQPNETPSLFSVRQITRHGWLERARSKERANEFGIPTEDGKCTHAPTFVRLTTVQSKTDE
jgi:hypothetical protein